MGLVQQEGSTGGAQPTPAPQQHLWLRGWAPVWGFGRSQLMDIQVSGVHWLQGPDKKCQGRCARQGLDDCRHGPSRADRVAWALMTATSEK